MWNKIIVCGMSAFLFSFIAISKEASSQETDSDSAAETTSSTTPQTAPSFPTRYDPKKPLLTQKVIKKILEVDIQKNLLEKKMPEELSKLKDRSEIITNIGFQMLMIQYNRLAENPELPEVTRIQPKWYKAYGEKLAQFKPIVASIVQAVNCNSANTYFLAIQEFKKHQEECLIFLKAPMPKISKEQYVALRKANTKRRLLEYKKYLKERRAAELKEIQEKRAKAAKRTSR